MNLDECTVYVFVRQDIPLAQQLVQALHAAWTAGVRFGWQQRDVAGVPFNVTIGVPDHKALNRVVRKLEVEGIEHSIFSDADISTEDTAVATAPLTKEQKLPLANYRLWRYSPGVAEPKGSGSLPSMGTGEPIQNADVAQSESTPYLTEGSRVSIPAIGSNSINCS